jgi:hypothetical protein
MFTRSRKLTVALAFCAFALLAACAGGPSTSPEGAKIPLEVQSQGAVLGEGAPEAKYLVVRSPDQIDSLKDELPSIVLEQLRAVSGLGEGKAAILAYAGVKSSSGYSIEVTSVRMENGVITIHVDQSAPGSDEIVEPATTQPYYLGVITIEDLELDQSMEVRFVDSEGRTIAQDTISVP